MISREGRSFISDVGTIPPPKNKTNQTNKTNKAIILTKGANNAKIAAKIPKIIFFFVFFISSSCSYFNFIYFSFALIKKGKSLLIIIK